MKKIKQLLSKFKKVIPALVEGRFLRKTGIFLKSLVVSLDRQFGIVAKYLLSVSTPVQKNKIIFITFQGDYTCNPKYITEEILAQGKNQDWDIVWTTRKGNLYKSGAFPEGVRLVEQYTYDFYKELASAKIWVANSVEFLKNPLYKKKGQVLIETWHGSLGIKKFDRDSNSGRRWVEAAELNGKIASYCISNSTFETDVYRGSFWPKTEILEYGHPRNDILDPGDAERREKVKQKIFARYGLSSDVKVALYAPTFRDSHTFSCYDIVYNSLIDALKDRFGGDWVVFVRFHPTVRKYSKGKLAGNDRVIDVTNYPDIQEIMAASDAAITDYSSWIYDFIFLRKPGFIFATDIERYNHERGFYYKLETTPFPIAVSNEELFQNIRNFDQEKYQRDVEEFLRGKGSVEDGHAAERVVAKIAEILENA